MDNVFGEWLAKTLEAGRITGGDLHARCYGKISRAAIYHYLKGSRLPDESCLGVMLSALGIDRSEVPQFMRKKPGRAPGNKHQVRGDVA